MENKRQPKLSEINGATRRAVLGKGEGTMNKGKAVRAALAALAEKKEQEEAEAAGFEYNPRHWVTVTQVAQRTGMSRDEVVRVALNDSRINQLESTCGDLAVPRRLFGQKMEAINA